MSRPALAVALLGAVVLSGVAFPGATWRPFTYQRPAHTRADWGRP